MIVKFETAKKAKEVGFDILCDCGYNPNYETLIEPKSAWHYLCKLDELKSGIQAPTQSELQRWLRETHNIQMIMQPYYDHYGIPKVTFVCDVICINDGLNDGYKHKSKKCNTYEEALEIGLNNGLKLIKNI